MKLGEEGKYREAPKKAIEAMQMFKEAIKTAHETIPEKPTKAENVTLKAIGLKVAINRTYNFIEKFESLVNKAGKVKVIHTVKTSTNWTFTDTIKPDAGGTWTVQANWEGSWKYKGVVSEKVSFEAVEKRCIIATVTYGSELAEKFSFLEDLGSNNYQTYAGSSFMTFFNS